MMRDNRKPNVVHIVRSQDEPNAWRCTYTADPSTPEGAELLRKARSPEGVLRWLEAAIVACWESLADHKKNLATLEREMRLLLDMTIENLHTHPQAFRIEGEPHDPTAAELRDSRILSTGALPMLHLAIETCHQMLPVDRRALDEVERQTRSLFEQSFVAWRSHPEWYTR